MEFYFAPMEGVTGYIYRNVYEKHFGGIDRYYAPFIATNQSGTMKGRDLKDILPENNCGLTLIPQLLSNRADDFVKMAGFLKGYGYSEVNLNLGCPSPTVVSKQKGSGFLADTERLDDFLYEVFASGILKISVKTRIGKETPEEFNELIRIFNKYPLEELIIHPRTQKDFYGNRPDLEAFQEALGASEHKVCYNGDIFTPEDYVQFTDRFPEVGAVMCGRGILRNPLLIHDIRTGTKDASWSGKVHVFHDDLYDAYASQYGDGRNVLFKMKELWSYMIQLYPGQDKILKKIRKATHPSDYTAAVAELFKNMD